MRSTLMMLWISGCVVADRQTSEFIGEDVRIELRWDTAVDLDLHLLDEDSELWSDGDVSWCNRRPRWEFEGNGVYPNLLLDDRNGNGPEVITVSRPRRSLHTVAVHQFGYGRNVACFLDECPTTVATVEVYLRGRLESTYTAELSEVGQTWFVAEMDHAEDLISGLDRFEVTDGDVCDGVEIDRTPWDLPG